MILFERGMLALLPKPGHGPRMQATSGPVSRADAARHRSQCQADASYLPGARLARRQFLASASILGLSAAAGWNAPAAAGEPFSDGSLFVEDGTGWVG